MSEETAIERRLSAVERAIADGDGEIAALAEAGDREERLRALEERVEAIEDSIADLEAATQALRGYVGNVRSVNEDVEQRADAALAAVERLEDRLGEGGRGERHAPTNRSADRSTGTRERADSTGRTARQNRHTDASRDRARSSEGATPSGLDDLDAGTEMPVPGAETGSGPPDVDDRHANGDHGTDGDGVLERVRDAL